MTGRVVAIGLLAAVLGYVLSQLGFGGKRAFSTLSFVIIIGSLGAGLGEIVGEFFSFSADAGVGECASVALKVLFVGYLFGICSDVASELSENTVAAALTLAGRVETVLLVLPYLSEVVGLCVQIIK